MDLADSFYELPKIIFIILNYGKGISFQCEVDFPEELDLSQYVNSQYSPTRYTLKSVIIHRGASGDSGHYIAYCKCFDGYWNCFNDDKVEKSYFEKCKEYGELPYVLFYEKN